MFPNHKIIVNNSHALKCGERFLLSKKYCWKLKTKFYYISLLWCCYDQYFQWISEQIFMKIYYTQIEHYTTFYYVISLLWYCVDQYFQWISEQIKWKSITAKLNITLWNFYSFLFTPKPYFFYFYRRLARPVEKDAIYETFYVPTFIHLIFWYTPCEENERNMFSTLFWCNIKHTLSHKKFRRQNANSTGV